MQGDPIQPNTCPDCGHHVYRLMMAPVRHPQRSCRAIVAGEPGGPTRCGCPNLLHRSPTMRPRHRLDPPASGSRRHLPTDGIADRDGAVDEGPLRADRPGLVEHGGDDGGDIGPGDVTPSDVGPE